jgi:hypothetical protein
MHVRLQAKWLTIRICVVAGFLWGLWQDWRIGFFDGFSVGSPPPPTLADKVRSWCVAIAFWAITAVISSAAGF